MYVAHHIGRIPETQVRAAVVVDGFALDVEGLVVFFLDVPGLGFRESYDKDRPVVFFRKTFAARCLTMYELMCFGNGCWTRTWSTKRQIIEVVIQPGILHCKESFNAQLEIIVHLVIRRGSVVLLDACQAQEDTRCPPFQNDAD